MSHPEQPADRPAEARPAPHSPATPQPDPTAPPPVSQPPQAAGPGEAAGGGEAPGTGPDPAWAPETPTGYDPAGAQAYAQTHTTGHGTPGYGTPGYGTPGYGTPGYGTPGYGTPGYGTPGYGAPSYGTPGYGTPGYGTPGYGGQQPADPAYASSYAYGQPAYPAYSFAYAPPPRTNGLAVASMSVSISAMVLMLCTNGISGFLGLVGAILGHVSRRQVRERGEAGGGMALAGVIVGWIAAGLALLAVAAFVLFMIFALDESAEPYTT